MRSNLVLRLSFAILATAVVACANPADGVAEAEVTDSQGAGSSMEATEGMRLAFAPESTIGFTGSKVTGSHDGGFREFGGAIVLVNKDPTRSRVEVDIDARTLWSDNDRLTGHLKSADFFDVETYPEATFRSTSIAATAEGFEITGDLDLHGVVKSVTFPASIEVAEDHVVARAEFVLRRFDFDIRYPGKPDDLIRDEVVVRLDLVAKTESGVMEM